MTRNSTILAQGAFCLAIASVLTLLPFSLPQGGAINGSMLPIILFSVAYGSRWGMVASVGYALLQMLTGFYPPPAQTFWAFVLVILLDYLLAFGAQGLAGTFYKLMPEGAGAGKRLLAACAVCYTIRFLCSFASGILIWASYAPSDMPVWLYSLLYNGSYMLGELVVAAVLLPIIGPKVLGAMAGPKAA